MGHSAAAGYTAGREQPAGGQVPHLLAGERGTALWLAIWQVGNSQLVDRFLTFWRESGAQRCGWLYGRSVVQSVLRSRDIFGWSRFEGPAPLRLTLEGKKKNDFEHYSLPILIIFNVVQRQIKKQILKNKFLLVRRVGVKIC